MATPSQDDLTEGDPLADPGVLDPATIKRGTIRDSGSGKMVQATPEELETTRRRHLRLRTDRGVPFSDVVSQARLQPTAEERIAMILRDRAATCSKSESTSG